MPTDRSYAITDIAAVKHALAASRWIFTPAAVACLLFAGWQGRSIVAHVVQQAAWLQLTLAICLWASSHLLPPLLSSVFLQDLDNRISYRQALEIHVSRLPSKYLPGGIWHTVSRGIDLHRCGVSHTQLPSLILLEHLVPVGVALTLGGLCLATGGKAGVPAIGSTMAGLAVLALTPSLLRYRALLPQHRLSLLVYAKMVSTSALFWAIAATAFAFYWHGFPAMDKGISSLQLYGIYLLAWVAGFVSIFAPQGIGVFEAIASVFLKGETSIAGVAVIVGGFRVVVLVADMLAFLALCTYRYSIAICRSIQH